MPTFFALIAQSVEHAAVNRSVTGSSPVWGAKAVPLKGTNAKFLEKSRNFCFFRAFIGLLLQAQKFNKQ